jgi:predicted alpha/beta-hydrolase family hydrolase
MTAVRQIGTPLGPARAHVTDADGPVRGTLVLGHGAGGGIGSADLVAVTATAAGAGWRVILVEQPWRVAGKRIAVAPPRLDEGWRAVLADLRDADLLTGPLVLGGRSAGARVACRTAVEHGAAGVLALAFPLHPPGRPEKSRAGELTAVGVPLVVVQGETDAFGDPAAVAAVLDGQATASVYAVPGDHALKKNVDVVAMAALSWLTELLGGRAGLSRGGGAGGGRAG